MRYLAAFSSVLAQSLPLAVLLVGACAYGDIYVLNQSGTVSSYYDSGEPKNPELIKRLNSPSGIAVDQNGFIYVSSLAGTVGKYAPDGSAINRSLFRIPNRSVSGLAIADGYIYTVSEAGDAKSVGKYTLEGRAVSPDLITGFSNPVSVEVSGNELYVSDWSAGRVGKYTTDGAAISPSLVAGIPYPNGLALDGKGYLFVSAHDSLSKYKTDGTPVSFALAPGFYFNSGSGLAIGNDGTLLVANNFGGPGGNVIRRYSQSGELLNAELIRDLSNPLDIAVVVPEPSPVVLLLFFLMGTPAVRRFGSRLL